MTIIDALETSRFGLTLRELAERMGLSERSVRRYLDEMHLVLEIECVRDEGPPRWRRKATKRGTRYPFSAAECLALARIRAAVLQQWRDAPWVESLKQAFARVEANIPVELLPLFHASAEVNAAAQAYPRSDKSEQLREEFETAARDRRVMAIRYRGMTSGEGVRKYDPYVLYVADGATYTYGHDHKSGEFRVLALDRVVLATTTKETFELPRDFSAEALVAELHHGYKRVAPVEVTVRVSGRAARLWQDRPEALDQVVERLSQGRLRVRFTASVTPALVARMLSFGAEVEVEGPRELRDRVAEQLRSAAKRYAVLTPRRSKAMSVERRHDRAKS